MQSLFSKSAQTRAVLCLPCAAVLLCPAFALAQSQQMEEIVVTSARASNLATQSSASAGTITATQVAELPILRPGEVLQLVPGMVVVAHAAGGKANQYYLRGFELDHGDMFLTEVDGVPVNLVSHAHGPGYTDLNWLIPELIGGVDYTKGPYYADEGDFANAGSANIRIIDSLNQALLKQEVGGNGYARLLGADSFKVGLGTLLLGVEYMHDDGPWTIGNNYRRRNGIVRYTEGDTSNGFSLTLQGYRGNWRGGDQVPLRGLDENLYPRYAVLNPDTGGTSSRYSLYGNWHETDDIGHTDAVLYAVHYTLDLRSDFTYFLDPNGDEIRQNDRRWIYGGHIDRSIDGTYLGEGTQDRIGVELRDDDIHNALDHLIDGQPYYHVRFDQIDQTMVSPWWENRIAWNGWFSTTVGVRADVLVYADHSDTIGNSGNGVAWKPSPKVGMRFGPWDQTDIYIQAGLGISSEDIRGVTSTTVPGPVAFGGGVSTSPTLPLTRNRGAEVGIHSKAIPGLDTTLSFWVLESQNEFVFDGDSGAVSASGRPGRRYGIEWNNRWQPAGWLDVTADIAISRARYIDQNKPLGDQIPESVRWTASGEATVHDLPWLPETSATLGWRYLGPRYLIENASIQSKPSLVFNARLDYALTPDIALGVQILNLFDTRYFDAQYYYATRLRTELTTVGPSGQDGFVVHPGEPRELRFSITERF
jgi:outer membrane receptor protein involved in Fe transport